MRRTLALGLAALVLGLAACAPGGRAADRELTVFAASSLADALDPIAESFGAAHGARVILNIGATTTLRAQLEQGARADVFAAADRVQMERAARSGLVADEQPVFALNRLVVVVAPESAGRITRLTDLASPGLRLVITGGDVPVGVYTREALARMSADPTFGADFSRRVLANVVSEEPNVRALLSRVQIGEADAAFVYASDAAASGGRVETLAIPDAFNVVAEYPAAVLREARDPALAGAFVRFLLDERAGAILRRHGFLLPGSAARRASTPG